MNSFIPRPMRGYLRIPAVMICLAGAIWAFWPGAVTHVASQNYLPHGFCYLWNPQLLSLHVVSDTFIFLSYLAISVSLAWLVNRERKLLPFAWILVAFGLFIVACGFTHAIDIVVLWIPLYWLAGDVKLVTAVASLITAAALPFYIPKIRQLLHQADTSQKNERRFLAASEGSQDAFFILESVRDTTGTIRDFRIVFTNARGARLLSGTPHTLDGQLLCEMYPPRRTDGFFEKYRHVVETGEALEEEFPVQSPSINASWLRYQVLKLDDGLAITATDISTLKENELKLEKLAAFKKSIIASSPFATIVTDLSGTITAFNPAAERMLWYSSEEVVGHQTPLILLDTQELTKRAAELSTELQTQVAPNIEVLLAKPTRGLVEEAEWKFYRHDGSRFDAQLTVSSLTTSSGETIGLILIAYDITERKRTADYIAHLAHHDALTGLPTRTLLHDRLGVALAHADRHRSKVALLVIDLDNFKRVNDLMGHHIGDELLVQIARRLQQFLRTSDTIARVGGDEFVAVLDELHSASEAEHIAEKLLLTLQVPVTLGIHAVSPTASIGICLYPDNGDNAETLLKNADAAMYQVKAEGKKGLQTFNREMASTLSRKRELETALHQALVRNEFQLLYQPQVLMRTGKVFGVEALLRWNNEKLGTVMPGEFIQIAEESNLIVPIGEWVLQTACRDGKRLQFATGKPLTIAVNISARQFHEDNLPRVIRQALTEADLDPASLELEITESVLVSDSPKAMGILDDVRSIGIRIAIDDFGTGFCSMSYIMRFQVDRLKIDRSFVRDMTIDSGSRAITNAVIALARGLDITIIAEGVETAAHRDLLFAEGCDEAQGYLYSPPVPIEELPEVIRSLEEDLARAEVEMDQQTIAPPLRDQPAARTSSSR
jgi:diguanylate cyclase (GGDEF)-like protein/PAS domain S-box-containing protein